MGAKRRLFAFGAIGGVGFAVDAGILQALYLLGIPPLLARCVSFPCAVTATWLLNRRFTFGDRPQANSRSQYALYVGGQIAGALINVAAFILTMHYQPSLSTRPLIPLVVGSATALIFNYMWANLFVFRPSSTQGSVT